MSMIKPRQTRVRIVTHKSRLQEPNRDVLKDYAEFIGDTPDWVLNQLIETTLARERDFLAWRAARASEAPVSAPERASGREAARRVDDTL